MNSHWNIFLEQIIFLIDLVFEVGSGADWFKRSVTDPLYINLNPQNCFSQESCILMLGRMMVLVSLMNLVVRMQGNFSHQSRIIRLRLLA
jgi:hypothetical protein